MSDLTAHTNEADPDPVNLKHVWEHATTEGTPDTLQIRAFGPPQLLLADQPLSFVRRKSVALLIYLAATRRPHTRDALANLLWGDLPQERAAANLRKVLVELREQIDAAVIITRHSVAINPAYPLWFDVTAFETAVERGIAATDVPALEAAADRYHDDFLAGFTLADADDFDEWVLLYREYLHSRLIQALQILAQIRADLRDDRAAIAATTRLIALDPWREEAYRQLMLILARNGERSAAIAQYEACRRVLAAELGVEPMEETTAIYQRLLVDPAPPAHTLPPVSDPFVGREQELQYIATRLTNPVCRMLTLVGLPGVGKTQLALHAAHAHLGRNALVEPAFPDGIYYLPLTAPAAGADPTTHALAAIAAAIGVSVPASGPLRQLEAALRGKTILLVLDDLDATGRGIEALSPFLARCPGITVLATSGSQLQTPEEWVLEITGLELPATPAAVETSPAGALLLHHAQRHGASNALTAMDREAIGRICRTVEGHPLALILAAHWRAAMSFTAIADGLARDLDLLETTHPAIPERHRSLRATLAQVVEHLPQIDRAMLQRLAVFAGGFDRDAARAVAEAPPLRLLALSGYSVLTCGREGRYAVPSLIRHVLASAPIAPKEVAAVGGRHATYYAGIVSSCACYGSEEPYAWRAIEAERENVRAAWDWAVRHNQIAMLMTMYEGIMLWYEHTGRPDEWAEAFGGAVRAARRTLRDRGAFPRALGWLLLGYGRAQMQRRHYAEAAISFEEARDRARAVGVPALEGRSLLASGEALSACGAVEDARARCREALALAEATGASHLEAESLVQLGLLALTANDRDEATALFERAIARYRDLQQPFVRSLTGIAAPTAYEKDALIFLCA
jgi:DNA-binding SARP family transcriptional activator